MTKGPGSKAAAARAAGQGAEDAERPHLAIGRVPAPTSRLPNDPQPTGRATAGAVRRG